LALDEKLRQAYFWIVNTAIISPHYDVEYNDGPPQSFVLGDTKSRLTLPSAQSYSSFVLLPLLTFAARRKCLFVGGPGRGKTASAILMGVLAGYPVREVRRAMQHGQPGSSLRCNPPRTAKAPPTLERLPTRSGRVEDRESISATEFASADMVRCALKPMMGYTHARGVSNKMIPRLVFLPSNSLVEVTACLMRFPTRILDLSRR
jgi:hypothetical protein